MNRARTSPGSANGARWARLLALLPAALLLVPAGAAFAGRPIGGSSGPTLVNLGSLGANGTVTAVQRVGGTVIAVGSIENTSRQQYAVAWRYDLLAKTLTIQNLSTTLPGATHSEALDVDSSGTIVGIRTTTDSSGHSVQQGFRLPAGATTATFFGTNVGTVRTSDQGSHLAGAQTDLVSGIPVTRAYRWDPPALTSTLLDTRSSTGANGVNDAGVAVGSTSYKCTASSNGCSSAVIWTPSGRKGLAASTAGWLNASPTDVTPGTAPLVVGYGATSTTSVPFVVQNASAASFGPFEPLSLPTSTSGMALGVNANKVVVGQAGGHAVRWTPTCDAQTLRCTWAYTDLNATAPSGWSLQSAWNVGTAGDVVGTGGYNRAYSGFLLLGS